MGETLKQRILEHGRRDRRDSFFAKQLLDLTERIERDFEGRAQERLLALAQDAFERHLKLRDQTQGVRETLAALQADQRRLLELFELVNARPIGEHLH